MIYLPKKVCLIVIHRNTAHRLDIHPVVISISMHYMYVDILFPLTKTIPVMFERVTTHYQTLKTWIGHNATCYHNINALPQTLPHWLSHILLYFFLVWGYLQRVTITSTCYHTRYCTFSSNLAWFWAICNALPCRQIYKKKCILIFF